jgi:penicillin V acylase-like amidase (Ntn superfamily)
MQKREVQRGLYLFLIWFTRYFNIFRTSRSLKCTAFTMTDNQNQVHMGRNYDFKLDTSAMLVYCTPPNGYKSVAFAALDNISANTPDESMKKKLATLTSPFICLDGMNEKGVSIAVLTPAYYTAVSTAKLEQRSFCSAQNPTSFGVKLAYGVVSAGNSQKEKA